MEIKECYFNITRTNYNFNDNYGLSFLKPYQYDKIQESLSTLRRLKEISGEEYHLLTRIFKHQFDNFYKIKELDYQQPRKIAQKFIGRKNIREFIFKRDNYKCLKCSSNQNITIDHINPIHNNGENSISNLQTLCKSCNSSKSSNYYDYRK